MYVVTDSHYVDGGAEVDFHGSGCTTNVQRNS